MSAEKILFNVSNVRLSTEHLPKNLTTDLVTSTSTVISITSPSRLSYSISPFSKIFTNPDSSGGQTSHPFTWGVSPAGDDEMDRETVFQGVHTTLTILVLGINCISLMVMYGLVPRLTPPLRVLTSLSFADMLAPWAIMTLYFSRSSCQDEIHTSVLLTAHNAVALTLLLLSIILHVATFRPLHYDRLTTPTRLWAGVGVAWAVAVLIAHVHFVVSAVEAGSNRLGFNQDDNTTDVSDWPRTQGGVSEGRSYCEEVESNTGLALMLSAAICLLTLTSAAFNYIRILIHLRPVEAFLQNTTTSGLASSAEITVRNSAPRKNTRGVINGIILHSCYAISWIPYLISKYSATKQQPITKLDTFSSYHSHPSHTMGVAVCQTLIIIGCGLNPIISGCRMTSLQLGYIQLGRRLRGGLDRMVAWLRRGLCRRRGLGDEIPTTPLNQIDSVCY